MALSGPENNEIAFGNISKPNSPIEDETLLFQDDPCFGNTSLSRQNSSLFSLTLNEIQTKSGKSVGSMNMDEFLATLWDVDTDGNVDNQVDSNGASHLNIHELVKRGVDQVHNENHNGNGGINVHANNNPLKPAPLARQGSFSIPSPICKKTVDEVWFEIQKDHPDDNGKPNLNLDAPVETPPLPHQSTLGEMTLEDFLVKAGVVQGAPQGASNVTLAVAPPATPATPGQSPLQKMLTPMQNLNACLDAAFSTGPMMGMAPFPPMPQNIGSSFSAYPMLIPTQKNGYVGEPSTNNDATPNAPNDQANAEPSAQTSKKRTSDGPPEVAVERRQKRMIKNRESAARSRARKQAYTVELELELTQLKEENAKLKQIVEEIEQNRNIEVQKIKSKEMKKDEKMKNIRRTMSLAW